MQASSPWVSCSLELVSGYRRMLDAAVEQLDEEQFFRRPANGFNSVANLLRHLGGNLTSRWTEFLTTDGEKDDRDRDAEFEDWDGDRQSLMAYFDQGWRQFVQTLESLSDDDLDATIQIRGEEHSVPQAIQRSLTHVSYHIGQLVMVARMVKNNDSQWQWLTIQPGQSKNFNASTWGTSASRGTMGESKESSE